MLKPSWLRFARYGWFVAAIAVFGARDMCFGGGGPPPEPEDAGVEDAPSDAMPDGPMSLRAPAPGEAKNKG